MTIKAKVTLQNHLVYEDSYATLPEAIKGLKYQIPDPLLDNLKPSGSLEVGEYLVETSSDIPVVDNKGVRVPEDDEEDELEESSPSIGVGETAKGVKPKK